MRALAAVTYFLLWAFGGLFSLIPFALKSAFASAVGWILFRVLRLRVHVVMHNLVAVFPRAPQEGMDDYRRRLERIGFGHYRHLVLVFLEILERFHWSPRVVRRRVELDGFEHLDRPTKAGQGMFVLTAHLGNWELVSLVGSMLEMRLAIVTRYLRNRFFDAIWKRSRRRYGIELLEESGSGLAIVRAVRRGMAVGFILDQFTGEPHGIPSPFLGVPTWCPKGLAILAPRLKAPVIPAYLLREKNGRFRLVVEPALEFPPDADLATHVRICNENIEKWVRRYPEQYLWVHKRFKGTLDYAAPLPWLL